MSKGGHYESCDKQFRQGIATSRNRYNFAVKCSEYIEIEDNGMIDRVLCSNKPFKQSCGRQSTWLCYPHYKIYCENNDMSQYFSTCANKIAKGMDFTTRWMESTHPYEVLEAIGCSTDKKYLHVQVKHVKEFEDENAESESEDSSDESFLDDDSSDGSQLEEGSQDSPSEDEDFVYQSDDFLDEEVFRPVEPRIPDKAFEDTQENDDFLNEEVFPSVRSEPTRQVRSEPVEPDDEAGEELESDVEDLEIELLDRRNQQRSRIRSLFDVQENERENSRPIMISDDGDIRDTLSQCSVRERPSIQELQRQIVEHDQKEKELQRLLQIHLKNVANRTFRDTQRREMRNFRELMDSFAIAAGSNPEDIPLKKRYRM